MLDWKDRRVDLHLGIFDSVVFLAFLGLAFQGHAVAAGAVLAVAFLCAAWRIRQRERRAQAANAAAAPEPTEPKAFLPSPPWLVIMAALPLRSRPCSTRSSLSMIPV
ncbi:MAG: hypothetical protein ACOC26_05795 [Halochromatium sp.]